MVGWEAPWHWVVLAILVIALFGYKKLPDASRALGRSLRIFKTEIKGMTEDDQTRENAHPAALTTPAQAAPQPQPAAQPQAAAQAVVEPAPAHEAQPAAPVQSPPSAAVSSISVEKPSAGTD